MSAFATIGAFDRESDWIIALVAVFIAYVILYPVYIIYLRFKYSHRIKNQLVTSVYKLPVKLAPTELSYIFSTRVKKPQLYATLLDLSNRGIAILKKSGDKKTIETGPRIENNLYPFETILLQQFYEKTASVKVEDVLEGFTSFEFKSGKKINGSRQYVFWWLLRDNLRNRGIIQKNLSRRYAYMLFMFGVIGSLVVSVMSVLIVRFLQMINGGEVDSERLLMSIGASLYFWIIMIIPMIFISFIMLKFRGRMLGREWIMTPKYRRYLAQMDAFREFVKLTHKDSLRFESKELKKESLAITRPYAIACGFIKM